MRTKKEKQNINTVKKPIFCLPATLSAFIEIVIIQNKFL